MQDCTAEVMEIDVTDGDIRVIREEQGSADNDEHLAAECWIEKPGPQKLVQT